MARRARACPSPCAGLNRKRPWPLGCGRFSFGSNVRGGQNNVSRPCRARSDDLDLFVIRRSQTTEHAPFIVGRGPVSRHASILAANIRGLWVAGVFRLGR